VGALLFWHSFICKAAGSAFQVMKRFTHIPEDWVRAAALNSEIQGPTSRTSLPWCTFELIFQFRDALFEGIYSLWGANDALPNIPTVQKLNYFAENSHD